MAVYRPIQISFWQKKFILKLTPEAKYFYIYLLTNSKTSQCGIYELPISVIELETGYNRETVTKLLEQFIQSGKIKYDYENEEVYILNWLKYNQISNENVARCVISELKEIKNVTFVKLFLKLIYKVNNNKDLNEVILGGLQGACKRTGSKETETESPTETETETGGFGFTNLNTDAFSKAWDEWELYRKQKKQKITPMTRKKQLEFLSNQPDPIACINKSIQQGWQGLFELKANSTNGTNKIGGLPPVPEKVYKTGNAKH